MRRLLIVALLLGLPLPVAAQLPERIEPVEVGDDDARLRLSLIAQLQLAIDYEENGDAEVTPRLRRVRPIAHARFFDGRLAARLHVEASPANPELIDAWVELTLDEALRIRGGQLKIPFTAYWQRSLTQMAVDWPLTSRWFGGERQLGAMAHGSEAGWSYALGVFSGQGRRAAFARELSRLYGDPMPNPSSLTDPIAPQMHTEFVGRVGHAADGAHPGAAMDLEGGDLRHAVALSFAWDTAPVRGRDFALRIAPEALFRLHGFSLVLVGYLGLAPTRVDGAEAIEPAAVGALAELGWHAHQHLELSLRYGGVALFDALREDAGSELSSQHELTFAVQVPILGRSLMVQTDAAWLRSAYPNGARDALRVRAQLQAAF